MRFWIAVASIFLSLSLATSTLQAAEDVFDVAQQAAQEGRYRDVVEILTELLAEPKLEPGARVVALSNRGIAYSLMNAYGLARRDLLEAIEIMPNHSLSLNHLGILAEQVDQDFLLARDFYERSANDGFPAGQVNLARMMNKGLGGSESHARARKLLIEAASSGYAMAYTPLGEMYLAGEGGPRKSTEGIELLRKAAKEGVISAQYSLGVAYERGLGVGRDAKRAADFYKSAALQGHINAQTALGYLYRRGVGVGQDFIQASVWYRFASDQGDALAMNRLSWLLSGCPVKQVCDGKEAVELALGALAVEQSVSVYDSLAAAYARTGQFDLAVSTLEPLVASMKPGTKGYSSYKKRLDSYRRGKPNQL